MNKIYFAIVDEDRGGIYISAKDTKEAKKLALTDPLISEHMDSYIDLRCCLNRGKNHSIRYTQLPSKVMTIEEIINERCHWWGCENEDCGQGEYFEYIERKDGYCNDYYKCPVCGGIFKVPYVNC